MQPIATDPSTWNVLPAPDDSGPGMSVEIEYGTDSQDSDAYLCARVYRRGVVVFIDLCITQCDASHLCLARRKLDHADRPLTLAAITTEIGDLYQRARLLVAGLFRLGQEDEANDR